MIAIIRHWKLKEGVKEEDWIKNWSAGTTYIFEHYGSLGASLHKAADGTFYAYVRWPNREKLEKMRVDSIAGIKPYSNKPFVEVIEEIILEPIDDQLKLSK